MSSRENCSFVLSNNCEMPPGTSIIPNITTNTSPKYIKTDNMMSVQRKEVFPEIQISQLVLSFVESINYLNVYQNVKYATLPSTAV